MYACFIRRQRKYAFETLSALFLLIAGAILFLKYVWLHLLYVPLLIVLALFYGPGIIIPLSAVVPLLEIRHFIENNITEELSMSIVVILCAVFTSVAFSRIRGERDRLRGNLHSLRQKTEADDLKVMTETAGSDAFLSHYQSPPGQSSEEIREILMIAKRLLGADVVSVFDLRGDAFSFKCSTESSDTTPHPEHGIMTACIQRRQPLLSTREASPGIIAAPIIDGSFMIGVMTAESARAGAFRETDLPIAEMFSHQLTKILQRQRINAQLQREHVMLRKLKDGSARLIAALRTDEIARSLIDAVYSIAPQNRVSIGIFRPAGDAFELIRQIGLTVPEGSSFDFKETRIGMVHLRGEPDYISDVRNERNILPFKIYDEGSLFMLPLLYENELLAILVYACPTVNAVRPYQIELLKVLANQASSSLANARLHEEIEKMAITDGLTGLYNHRNFQEKLSAEFKRLQRFSDPFSLLLLDIDFFKKVNDVHGHPAGDEVLRGVAAIIRETVRNIDVPARYGGEEFAVILLKTDYDGALTMAERLRKSIMAAVFHASGKDLKVTVSIGTATAPQDADTKEGLISYADSALYHAKKNGRNRCILWSDIRQEGHLLTG